MDEKIDKIKAKIEKLTEQQHKIEEKYVMTVARLVKNMTNKGIDIKILAGMILDAGEIIKGLPDKKEAWQKAGEKFLFKSKNKKPAEDQ
jgi:hypothetical protein